MSKLQEYLHTPLPVEAKLSQIFRKEDSLVIFDIGACEGEDSIRYAKLFPHSKVFAFEPLEENFLKAGENIRKWSSGSIQLFSSALSDENGEASFYISSGSPADKKNDEEWNYGNKSSSLLQPGEVTQVFSWLKFDQVRTVKTCRLDSFMQEHSLKGIDYIHMDVQGAELAVLKGAGEFLTEVKAVWMEVEKRELYKNQPLKKEVEDFMEQHGFFVSMEEMDKTAGDQLYLNSRFFPKEILSARPAKTGNLNLIRRGWNKISSVIHGEQEEYRMDSFSQSGEDLIVAYIFRVLGIDKPTYMDIGAHHPFRLSNTALFYKRGCSGINIEPDPELFSAFQSKRSRDINLNIGIGKSSGELTFYKMDVPALNTFSQEEALRMQAKHGHKIVAEVKVDIMTPSQVVDKYHGGSFPHFLSIDVEGFEQEILSAIDLNKTAPLVVCLETISYETNGTGVKNTQLIDEMMKRGYMVYADTYINTIFVKQSAWLNPR